MRNWMKLLSISIITIMFLVACGGEDVAPEEEPDEGDSEPTEQEESEDDGNEATTDDVTYEIGVSQFVEHPSLDAAYDGFQQAIEDAGLNVNYDFQNAQGDQNNTNSIGTNLVSNNVDLIFANATPSAQGVYNATKDIPIVFASVSDPVSAGLVNALDEPGENITGVIDLHPEFTQKTIEFIDSYFPDSSVGLIYNSGEQNSVAQVESVEAALEGTSLELVTRSVSTSAEVQQAAQSLVGSVEVILVTTDNTVVTALETVIGVGNDHGIPVVVGEPDSLERGGFATYGVDFYSIGYRAGEMAVEILTGEKTPSEINVEIPPEMPLYINKSAAEAQGVEWNDEWDNVAEIVE